MIENPTELPPIGEVPSLPEEGKVQAGAVGRPRQITFQLEGDGVTTLFQCPHNLFNNYPSVTIYRKFFICAPPTAAELAAKEPWVAIESATLNLTTLTFKVAPEAKLTYRVVITG